VKMIFWLSTDSMVAAPSVLLTLVMKEDPARTWFFARPQPGSAFPVEHCRVTLQQLDDAGERGCGKG
jgi:hypothetical protein